MDGLVLAIAADEKTVTRRIIAPKLGKNVHPAHGWRSRARVDGTNEHGYLHIPIVWVGTPIAEDTWDRVNMRAAPGDIMDVCEALVPRYHGGLIGDNTIHYRADGREWEHPEDFTPPRVWRWKVSVLPARYCPAWAVRHQRRLISVRPERLSDVTDAEAVLEGIRYLGWPETRAGFIEGFMKLHGLESDRVWVERREWAPGEVQS
jgi:hypothetical protein